MPLIRCDRCKRVRYAELLTYNPETYEDETVVVCNVCGSVYSKFYKLKFPNVYIRLNSSFADVVVDLSDSDRDELVKKSDVYIAERFLNIVIDAAGCDRRDVWRSGGEIGWFYAPWRESYEVNKMILEEAMKRMADAMSDHYQVAEIRSFGRDGSIWGGSIYFGIIGESVYRKIAKVLKRYILKVTKQYELV